MQAWLEDLKRHLPFILLAGLAIAAIVLSGIGEAATVSYPNDSTAVIKNGSNTFATIQLLNTVVKVNGGLLLRDCDL